MDIEQAKRIGQLVLSVCLLVILLVITVQMFNRGGIPLLHGIDNQTVKLAEPSESFRPGKMPAAENDPSWSRVVS